MYRTADLTVEGSGGRAAGAAGNMTGWDQREDIANLNPIQQTAINDLSGSFV